MQDGLIITMADLVESRDSDTGAHVQKTAAYVKIIAEGLKKKGYYPQKLTPKFMSDVVRSAPLHDVGKINIPDAVLNAARADGCVAQPRNSLKTLFHVIPSCRSVPAYYK